MNDTASTIVGLKAQDCPGGDGYTVSECLARDGCGCIYGDAVRHIERLQDANAEIERLNAIIARYVPGERRGPDRGACAMRAETLRNTG